MRGKWLTKRRVNQLLSAKRGGAYCASIQTNKTQNQPMGVYHSKGLGFTVRILRAQNQIEQILFVQWLNEWAKEWMNKWLNDGGNAWRNEGINKGWERFRSPFTVRPSNSLILPLSRGRAWSVCMIRVWCVCVCVSVCVCEARRNMVMMTWEVALLKPS